MYSEFKRVQTLWYTFVALSTTKLSCQGHDKTRERETKTEPLVISKSYPETQLLLLSVQATWKISLRQPPRTICSITSEKMVYTRTSFSLAFWSSVSVFGNTTSNVTYRSPFLLLWYSGMPSPLNFLISLGLVIPCVFVTKRKI
jgi:hypothetical protein